MREITEDEFDDEFEFIKNPIVDDGETYMFETTGPELDFVKAQPINTVWTRVDGDDTDRIYIMSGFHVVNRIGYYITTTPWTEETLFCCGAYDDDEVET
jgi:hypothetical protein